MMFREKYVKASLCYNINVTKIIKNQFLLFENDENVHNDRILDNIGCNIDILDEIMSEF